MEEMVEFEGEVVRETDMAWLFDFDGDPVWLPKSQCEWDGVIMEVPRWLALKKEMV
jgi:hypothetical protein